MRFAASTVLIALAAPTVIVAQSQPIVARDEPLDRYVLCQYADSLEAASTIRLPGRGVRYRTVETASGNRKVSLVDGYRIMLAQGQPSYFANMKVEMSDPKQYDRDKDAVIKELEFMQGLSSTGKHAWEHTPFNGFDVYGLMDHTMDANGPNGVYVMFQDSTKTIVTIYFLGQKPEYRKFKTIEDHDAIVDRMLEALTMCGTKPSTMGAGSLLPTLTTAAELDAFMNVYYLKPRPELIGQAIFGLGPTGITTNVTAQGPVTAFFSEVFAANPSRITQWEQLIEQQPPFAKQMLHRAVEWSKAGGVLALTGRSAEMNDLYWGAFFASGNPAYVKKLLEVVPFADDLDDFNLWAAGSTARWSLASNAQQHDRVRSILEAEKSTADKRMQEMITEMLTGDPGRFKLQMQETYARQKAAGKWK